MFDTIKSGWEGFWAFFKNSGTILLARLEVLVGFVISAFSFLDFSPLLALDMTTAFNWRQTAFIGVVMMIKGVVSEITRRAGTTTVKDTLVPDVVVEQPKTMARAIRAKAKAEARAAKELRAEEAK